METIIAGVFPTRKADEADMAIKDLMDIGVSRDKISFVHLDKEETIVTSSSPTGEEIAADVGAGAAGGAATGAMVGVVAGLVAATGIIPGLGAIFVAGPLATALGLSGGVATTVAGTVTGAIAGGLVGALVNLGVSNEDAEIYQERIQSGDVLLIAEIDNGADLDATRRIFNDRGAEEVRIYNS